MKVVDPLAQSFYVESSKGIFVTSIDLYFISKDPILPVTVQLRPMELGLPTEKVYPFGEVVVDPDKINAFDNSAIPTRIKFPSPVYLTGQKFHALTILTNSQNYSVWVARLGEVDITTLNGAESSQVIVTKQPISGGLFKSQNGLTWNESPFEDLKFTLYRADFTTTDGNFNFYNPELGIGNKQIATLMPNSLAFSSRKIRVGLGTTVIDNNIVFGNTVYQKGSNATGNYVASAGIATQSLTIVNPGIGYTPSSGSLVYSNVSLTNITGNGKNATANITISDGVAIAATILNGGTGYVVGDVLSVSQIGSETLGKNLRLSVSSLAGINQLILDNVQGDFITGTGSTISYFNSLGISSDLNYSIGGGVLIPADGIEIENNGLNIRVNHRNHGMHAGENIVKLSNVLSDVKPVKLTENYDVNSTANISVDSTVNFSTFENVGISSTNPGYALIGDEIISYEGVTTNSLTGITRQIDQTLGISYTQGTSVYKYELNGISLRRINTTHTLQDSDAFDPIDFDYYHIKIDTSSDGKTDPLPNGQVDRTLGTNFPKLYANETKSTGGNFINATQNIQYEIVRPNIQTTILNGTDINASIRTVSGTSVDGTETSFEDKGFVDIELNQINYFDSPRLICSKVNETERLSLLPGNKSLSMNLRLQTSDPYISPFVDLDRASLIFTSNRINSPIQNYITDNRVNNLEEDPSSFVYTTNNIQLEIPASSLKVIVSAYINVFSDLRMLYSIKNEPNEKDIYYLFPGYSNITDDGSRIISESLNDGTSDKKVLKTDTVGYVSSDLQFKDYEFTVSNLPSFKYFSIKMIASGTNQALPPRLSDFRVIALV
jgi:hypothetical protein